MLCVIASIIGPLLFPCDAYHCSNTAPSEPALPLVHACPLAKLTMVRVQLILKRHLHCFTTFSTSLLVQIMAPVSAQYATCFFSSSAVKSQRHAINKVRDSHHRCDALQYLVIDPKQREGIISRSQAMNFTGATEPASDSLR